MGREEENGGDLDECGKGTGKGKGEVERGSWKGKWEGVRGTMDMGKGLRGRGEGKRVGKGEVGYERKRWKKELGKGNGMVQHFQKRLAPTKRFSGNPSDFPWELFTNYL